MTMSGIGIPRRQLLGLVETTPDQHVHRQAVLSRGGEDAVDARVGGIGRWGLVEHDPDPDRAFGCGPSRHGVGDAGVYGVHRLHQAKSAGVGGIDVEGIAGVEPI